MNLKRNLPVWVGLAALLVFCLFAPVTWAATSGFAGEWEGAIDVPGTKLGISVRLEQSADGAWKGIADIPAQGAAGLQLAQFNVEETAISFAFAAIPASFEGQLSADGNTLEGTFLQNGLKMPFKLERKGSQQPAADPLAGFDAFIVSAMQEFKVPGLAMAIVKDGKVIMSAGYGLRDVEQGLPVTPDTMFQIGSSTKAFTATVFEMMVEEGKLDWDKPVRDYIAGYRLWDDFATERITPRDWATHRSGLPRHDLMWLFNPQLDPAQVIANARYLEPNKDFRTAWQYNNLGYVTLGQLIAQAAGKPWSQVVQEKILTPLGMTNTTFDISALQAASNYALPYSETNGVVSRVPLLEIGAAEAAGAINSNITDMAKWVMLQLNKGRVGSQKIIDPAGLASLYNPQIPLGAPSGLPGVEHQSYGLGWFVESYQGHYHVYHGGNTAGFSALVSFLPKDNIGLVILTNAHGSALPTFLAYSAMDRLLNLSPIDWLGIGRQSAVAAQQAVAAIKSATGIPNTQPTHPLTEYTGEYTHPAYGTVTIGLTDGNLTLTYYQAAMTLKHKHYDQFTGEIAWATPIPIPVRFETDDNGAISQVLVGFEPTTNPIPFTRKPADQLANPAYLAKLAGAYKFQWQPITFEVRGTTLYMIIPGQPAYKMVPQRDNRFNMETIPGFSVEFVLDTQDGSASKAIINQLGSIVEAERVK